MIYLTGDIHGDISKICLFIEKHDLSANDIIIILGDVGLNYYGNSHGDAQRKKKSNRYGVPIFCIHGNHEIRPYTIKSYSVSSFHGGEVYVEEDYPNLIFAKDGEVYDFNGKSAIVLGGAYSVDKYYRFAKGLLWCDDEQPSDEIKQYCELSLSKRNWKTDYILSHTCPKNIYLVKLLSLRSTKTWLTKAPNIGLTALRTSSLIQNGIAVIGILINPLINCGL